MRMPGLRVGKSGVEAGFDSELRGDGGVQKIEVDARGRITRNLEVRDPIPGRDVTLTIDLQLQQRIFERLRKERCASCAVLDVRGGEIVAMASTPGYDPAEVTEAPTEETWRRLTTAEDKPLLNRAIGGQYPPGSTFKIVTGLAGLHMRVVTPTEKIVCRGSFELAGHTFRCWNRSGHGAVACTRRCARAATFTSSRSRGVWASMPSPIWRGSWGSASPTIAVCRNSAPVSSPIPTGSADATTRAGSRAKQCWPG